MNYFDILKIKQSQKKYDILSSIMKKIYNNDPLYQETKRNKLIILDGDIILTGYNL